MMDVDFGDVIDYLGDDPNVSNIVMVVENLNKIRNFMSAARAVSKIKPLVVLKAGRTRAIRPEDAALMEELFQALSDNGL
jgi:acetyltransferase